jgi:hypothetical protein
MKYLLALLLALFIAMPRLKAIDITENVEVSLITCGQGSDLYAVFGHSAIHIYDPVAGVDKVYNYGTFDFNTPNFYVKFVRGQLEYALAVSTFSRFVYGYQMEGRWVIRQLLDLEFSESQELYSFLNNNALPQNKFYEYDFFYDNCSSRIRDVFENVLDDRLSYPAAAQDTAATFREMIGLYLGNHPWSDLGIDLALGVPCDKNAGYREKMFLPDYLMMAIGDAVVERGGKSRPLVLRTQTILQENPAMHPDAEKSIAWAFWVFFGLCLLGSIFIKPKKMKWFDVVFFGVTGLLGIVVLLLWFATDHQATKFNMNILWALPSWLYGAYLVGVGKTESRFFKFHSAFLFFVVVAWMWIPQTLNTAVIPVVLALITRSWSWQKQLFTKQTLSDGNKT